MIRHIYNELSRRICSKAKPIVFPTECPLCGAGVESEAPGGYSLAGPTYKCGGGYKYKDQIQNHHDIWWGSCPIKREEARLERGHPCGGCGEKRLEGTGFPRASFGWKCKACNHENPREVPGE
jgi:hypothetical protein